MVSQITDNMTDACYRLQQRITSKLLLTGALWGKPQVTVDTSVDSSDTSNQWTPLKDDQ